MKGYPCSVLIVVTWLESLYITWSVGKNTFTFGIEMSFATQIFLENLFIEEREQLLFVVFILRNPLFKSCFGI